MYGDRCILYKGECGYYESYYTEREFYALFLNSVDISKQIYIDSFCDLLYFMEAEDTLKKNTYIDIPRNVNVKDIDSEYIQFKCTKHLVGMCVKCNKIANLYITMSKTGRTVKPEDIDDTTLCSSCAYSKCDADDKIRVLFPLFLDRHHDATKVRDFLKMVFGDESIFNFLYALCLKPCNYFTNCLVEVLMNCIEDNLTVYERVYKMVKDEKFLSSNTVECCIAVSRMYFLRPISTFGHNMKMYNFRLSIESKLFYEFIRNSDVSNYRKKFFNIVFNVSEIRSNSVITVSRECYMRGNVENTLFGDSYSNLYRCILNGFDRLDNQIYIFCILFQNWKEESTFEEFYNRFNFELGLKSRLVDVSYEFLESFNPVKLDHRYIVPKFKIFNGRYSSPCMLRCSGCGHSFMDERVKFPSDVKSMNIYVSNVLKTRRLHLNEFYGDNIVPIHKIVTEVCYKYERASALVFRSIFKRIKTKYSNCYLVGIDKVTSKLVTSFYSLKNNYETGDGTIDVSPKYKVLCCLKELGMLNGDPKKYM